MTTTAGLVPLDAETSRALTNAASKAATWTEKRNSLVRQAIADGARVREVARLVSLSHSTVLNIVTPKKRGKSDD